MTPELVLTILIGTLFFLLFSGTRIAFVMLATGFIGLLFLLSPSQPGVAGAQLWNYSYSYVLTTIPMFIFMAEILMRCGITKESYDGISALLGGLRGSEAYSTVLGCAVFAALSGSSVANAAAIGTVSYPEMRRRGYSDALSLGMVASGGTLGILIPPSSSMIIYGSLTGESIGKLFIAGIIPGLIMTSSFLTIVFIWQLLRQTDFPASDAERISIKNRIRSVLVMSPTAMVIVVVLGGIYFGIMTPTEAAGIGASASMILGLAKRRLSWSILVDSTLGTIKATCMIMLIVLGASLLTYVLGFSGVTGYIIKVVTTSGMGYWPMMISIVVFYMILGCFIEAVSLMVLTIPIMHSIMNALGFSTIWFAVLMVVCIEMGQITPPVGLNLFVIMGVAGEKSYRHVVVGAIPFIAVMLVVALLLIAYPQIALWLPQTM